MREGGCKILSNDSNEYDIIEIKGDKLLIYTPKNTLYIYRGGTVSRINSDIVKKMIDGTISTVRLKHKISLLFDDFGNHFLYYDNKLCKETSLLNG